MGPVDRITRWALRRAVAGGEGTRGRLVWVDAQGEAWDLGLYERADLVGLAWSHGVADRIARERYDRARLAAVRHAATRLYAVARQLPRPPGPEKGGA